MAEVKTPNVDDFLLKLFEKRAATTSVPIFLEKGKEFLQETPPALDAAIECFEAVVDLAPQNEEARRLLHDAKERKQASLAEAEPGTLTEEELTARISGELAERNAKVALHLCHVHASRFPDSTLDDSVIEEVVRAEPWAFFSTPSMDRYYSLAIKSVTRGLCLRIGQEYETARYGAARTGLRDRVERIHSLMEERLPVWEPQRPVRVSQLQFTGGELEPGTLNTLILLGYVAGVRALSAEQPPRTPEEFTVAVSSALNELENRAPESAHDLKRLEQLFKQFATEQEPLP